MKEFRIYQLKNTPENRNIMSMSMDYLERQEQKPEISRYQMVHKARLDDNVSLDDLFTKFNTELPKDYKGRSMSVGDVIVVSDDTKSEAYFVDIIGFRQLPDFTRDMPIYRHSAAYAREAGELTEYRASFAENVRCKNMIEETIAANFDGMHLKPDVAALVIDQYGAERVSLVLANTLMLMEYDGRFSPGNKQWAQTVDVPMDRSSFGDMRNHEYQLTSHPAILNGFVSLARKELEPQKTVTLSVHTKREKEAPASRQSLRETLRSNQERVKNQQAKAAQASLRKDRDGLE